MNNPLDSGCAAARVTRSVPKQQPMDTTSILDHLEEMRRRILRSLAAVLIVSPGMWSFSAPLIDQFKIMFCPEEMTKLYFTAPMELFFLRLKLSLAMSILLCLPYLTWNLWSFVAPGLYRDEKRKLLVACVISTFLFLMGAAFALLLIFPLLMKYSMGMATEQVAPLLSVGSVFGMAILLMLGFGVSFQLPLLVWGLVKMNLVSLETIRKSRVYIVVAIFIVSAALTPPDVVSMFALAIPTLLLFELTLFLLGHGTKKAEQI